MDRRLIPVAVVVILVVVAAVAILAMQNQPSAGTNGGNDETGTGDSVDIRNFAFDPGTLIVANGTTVTWTNNDPAIHTVTFDNGPFTSSGNLAQGQTFSVTFDRTGTFNYHCIPHPDMVARIIVE